MKPIKPQKTHYYIMFILSIFYLQSLVAQNSNLTIAPNYMFLSPGNPPVAFPLPTASGGYIGTSSSGPSSIYAGADGKPLVFASVSGDVHLPLSSIVGETTTLYNKNGYLIGGLNQLSNLPFQGLEEKEVISNNETIIVPDPGNCKRFYVLGTAENFSDLPTSGGVADNGYFPFFAVVDLSLPITNAPLGEFGQITTPGATSQMNIKNLYDLVPNLPLGGTNNNRPYTVTTKIAVTKSNVNDGDSRLIFVYSDGYMFIYKLTASGIQYIQVNNIGVDLFINSGGTHSNLLGELEIFEEVNKIKFAVPISSPDAGNNGQPNLGLFEMSTLSSSPYVFSNPKNICVSNCVGSPYYNSQIGGVEFSPNGQYVFFTHEQNATYQDAIEWIEFNNISNRHPIIPAGLSTMSDFQRSQIELGLDGKMYFATSNRLVSISNPNSPSITITYPYNSASYSWNDNALNLNNNLAFQSAYLLPDQIDQDTYGGFYENTVPCCYLYSNFNIEKDFYFPETNTVIGPNFPVQVTGKDSYGFPMTVEFTSTTTTKGNIYIPEKASVTFNNLRLEFKPEYIPVNPNDPEDVYSPGVGLIVKSSSNAPNNGGRLTTNASTLTVYNKCEQKRMWAGVEVWGQNIASQGSFTNSVEGWMKMNIGTVIEHAITGITIGDVNGALGGGVVEGTSSTIRNCQTALYITAASAPLVNKTIFTNTEFKLTQELIDVNRIPEKLVKSVDVIGIRFRSCKFFNTYIPYNQTVYGVLSTDSKINFTQFGARSTFENLAFGIYASSTITGRVINCHYSDFTRNIVGAYVTTTNSCSFTNNRFRMIDNKNDQNYFSTGLILSQSSKFTINDNYFSNADPRTIYANNPTIGIIIDNSNATALEDNFIH